MASFVFPNNPTDDQLVVNSDTGLTYRWIANPGKWVIQTIAEPTVDALPLTGGTMLGPIVFSADQPTGTDTTANILQLVDGTVDNSATKAASAASVKTTYDLASNAIPGTGGTIIGGNLIIKQSADGAQDGRLYVKDWENNTNFTVFPTGNLETKGTLTNSSTTQNFKIRAAGASNKGIEFLTGISTNSLNSLCLFNDTNIESYVPFHTKGEGISVQNNAGTTVAGMDSSGNITAGGYINIKNGQNVKQFRTYGFGNNILAFYVGDDANSLTRVVDFEAGGIDVSVPVGGGISGNDPLVIGSSVTFTQDNAALLYTGAPGTSFQLNTSTVYGANTYTNSLFEIEARSAGGTIGSWIDSLQFKASGIQTISYLAADASYNEGKVLRFSGVNSGGVLSSTLDLEFDTIKAYKELYLYSTSGNNVGGRISVPNSYWLDIGDQAGGTFMRIRSSSVVVNSPAQFSGSTFTIDRGCSDTSHTTNFSIKGFTEAYQTDSTNIVTIKRSPYGDTMMYTGLNDEPTSIATIGDLTSTVDGLTMTTGLTLTNSEVPDTGALRFKLESSNQDNKKAYILFQGGGHMDGTGAAQYIFGRDTVAHNIDPNNDIWFKLHAPYGSYGTPSTEFVQPVSVPTATAANHAISKGDVENLIASLGENVGSNPHYTGTFVRKTGDTMTDALTLKLAGEQKNGLIIKNQSDNEIALVLWCPGGAGQQLKYVGRNGTDHWFQNYHSEDSLVNTTAKFGYGNYHLYASDIVQYNATDAHYFLGSIYVKHGSYENFRVQNDGTLYGREGMVPTIDRAIANKKYVDDRTPTATSAVEGVSKRGAVCTTSEATPTAGSYDTGQMVWSSTSKTLFIKG